MPLPIVYFALAETGVKIPFPEQAMEEGNKFVGRVAKYYGWNLEGADGARMMLNMATSYAVVKVNSKLGNMSSPLVQLEERNTIQHSVSPNQLFVSFLHRL